MSLDSSVSTPANRVLLVCHEPIGKRMSGPAVRYWELAAVLKQHFAVTLAHPGESSGDGPCFCLRGYDRFDPQTLSPLVAWADVIIAYGYLLHRFPLLWTSGKPLVVDIYDIFVLENLEHRWDLTDSHHAEVSATDLAILNGQLRCGDYYICASERQRDFWLGMVAANGRVNHRTYGSDRTLRQLIDVVPFGLRSTPPRKTGPGLKGVHPRIGLEDKLLVWGGGLWDWFDPGTLIRAVAKVSERRQDVKLFFMAKQHPDPSVVPEMQTPSSAVKLSRDLGLLNDRIFFGDWIPYEERANYLLEADIGVSLHKEGLETHFAFRTRLLDYIWAGLPILATSGDVLGDLAAAEGIGRAVHPGDVDGVAAAILEMLEERDLKTRVQPDFCRVASKLTWEKAAQPLVEFLRSPQLAPDRLEGSLANAGDTPANLAGVFEAKPTPYYRLPLIAWRCLRAEGVQTLLREVRQYVRFRRGHRRGLRNDQTRGDLGS